MVWYSHLFKNFPQFVVIHTVEGFGVVNKADVFLELLFRLFWHTEVVVCLFLTTVFVLNWLPN